MQALNIHSLCDSINNLCEFLDNEYYINEGGCCFIASLISKYLDKLKIPYELVAYDQCGKNIDCVQHEVLNKSKNKTSRTSITGHYTCCHYCLSIKGAGEVNKSYYSTDDYQKYNIKEVTSSNIQWIYRNGSWNDAYDTSNNKIIKGIVKSFFKKYETSC